ncbi:MAG: NAD(P)-dependent oxidoreductase [bacterium]|nr:NAD(P)-dependent oxidoreductase [bacterium]
MIKILVADEVDLSGADRLSAKNFSVKTEFGISNDKILNNYRDYDVLVLRSIRKIDKKFLDNCKFRIIATCSKGTDHINVEYALKKGIKVLNADEGNHISAAEHTLSLMLAISKQIVLSDTLVRKDNFAFYDYQRNELFGKAVGIIGFGKVGSYVGKLCKAFGMKVYANDIDQKVKLRNKKIEFKSIDFILKNCKFITVHIPLNKKNLHFISKIFLLKINRQQIFINTSRGDVVDEKWLLKLLKSKKIYYAGLDVFSGEPAVDRGFVGLSNVLLTNHIAGKTVESRRRISESIFSQIEKSNNTFVTQ